MVEQGHAGEYNELAEVLRGDLRSTHLVCKLLLAERQGRRVSFCSWADFAPFVMPPCDVVDVVSLRRMNGKIVGGASTGYIAQTRLFGLLADLVREVRVPVPYFICDVAAPTAVQDKVKAVLASEIEMAVPDEKA